MKYLICLLLVILSAEFSPFAIAARQSPPGQDQAVAAVKELANVDAMSRWMTYYYKKPSPDLLVPALLLADKQGLLQGDSVAPLQAFSSRVFAQNPEKIKEWFKLLLPISDSGKTVVLTAVWWSNTKEGKELLDNIAAGLSDKSKRSFREQIDSAPPVIETMEISSPDVLDMLWASFSATGDTRYVKRLMSTLPWAKTDTKDLPKMLIASAARWSLISNINQHERVRECCELTAKTDAALKPYLEKILLEAAAAAKAEKENSNTQAEAKNKRRSKSTEASPLDAVSSPEHKDGASNAPSQESK